MKKLFFVLLISLNSCNENQELNIVVNNLFQDNMIIQHNSETPIWGTVKPNKQVKIEMSWGDKYKTLADSKGNWRINIKTPIADNIPHSIRVESSDDEIIFNNILLGEVWLASGQSNMQWRMRRSENKNELSNSVFNNKKIRMITVDRNLSLKPLSKFSGEWKICSTETISDFSAVGYFFAKKLYDELDVPIGIINSSVGGTPAESWSNINNLEKVNGFENLRERFEISNDTNSDYNLWLSNHKYVNRDEFINKKEIKFFDKKNKLFLDEEFNDTNWKVRSLDEIRTIFKKKEVDLSIYSRFQNSHDDFDGAVWLRNDFVINKENILNI
jgi:sialate O-acetylesterase